MAGFCELAIGLRAPKLAAAGAKSAIVSGGYLKYYRFWETATGDRVRSGLRGGRRSPIGADVRQDEIMLRAQSVQSAFRRVFATNRPYVRFSTLPRGQKENAQTRRVSSSTTHRAPGRFIAG